MLFSQVMNFFDDAANQLAASFVFYADTTQKGISGGGASVMTVSYGLPNPLIRNTMHLTPKEKDKLILLSIGMIAERRLNKGLKLNYPEAVAYITSAALEMAREGKTVEETMHQAAQVLTKDQVMDGVADMINLLQVEAVFTDGSRLVSIHHPIK